MNLQSEHINELASALSKAQGEMSHAVKDSTNPHFKSKYSDLASVWRACREPLSKNGLSVIQTMDISGEGQVLVTTLAHSSGQFIRSVAPLPIQKPGPQEIVSCTTYMRRISLAAIVGVYQDDDDAEVAQNPYRAQPKPVAEEKPISKDQMNRIKDLMMQINDDAYFKNLQEYLNVETIWEIKPKDFDRTIRSLENKIKQMKEVPSESSVA